MDRRLRLGLDLAGEGIAIPFSRNEMSHVETHLAERTSLLIRLPGDDERRVLTTCIVQRLNAEPSTWPIFEHEWKSFLDVGNCQEAIRSS